METIKNIIPYVVIIIVVLLIRTFVMTPVRVNGPSMDNTLENGQIMILNKLGKYKRGDIVVVDLGTEKIIKRIVGLPGESIYCLNGEIYINDKKYKEDYTSAETLDFTKVFIQEDEYFVLGDNRTVSMDSRTFGPINKSQIMGTNKLRIWPLSKFGLVK